MKRAVVVACLAFAHGTAARADSKLNDSSRAIVRAVAGLSVSLGIATTAEGVEIEEQLARLRLEGCTEIQGFLFSGAKPAAETATFIAAMHRPQAAA